MGLEGCSGLLLKAMFIIRTTEQFHSFVDRHVLSTHYVQLQIFKGMMLTPCFAKKKTTGDSNGVKDEKEAVGATEEASVSEVKTENSEKLVENQDKIENDPSKVISEEHKELIIAQEEFPVPGLVLTTKRLKSSKVKLNVSPFRMLFAFPT